MTRIRVFGLLALDSLLLTFLSALEPLLTLGHAHSDQARVGHIDTDARKVAGHALAVGGIEVGGTAGTPPDRQETSPAPS